MIVSWRACIALLAAAPGIALAADIPLPGKLAIVKRDPGTGIGELSKFVARAPKGGPFFPVPATGDGEDPTIVGATLRVCRLSGGCGAIVLPAARWKGLGKPAGSKGFKYKGEGSLEDPCKIVVVRPRVVRAVCKGSRAVDPLFAIPVGSNSVTHSLEVGAARYCTLFPPPFKKDDASKGTWRDAKAPPPGSCPSLPPAPTPTAPLDCPTPSPTIGPVGVCGNGVIEPGEQCDGASLGGETCTTAYSFFETCSGQLACGSDCKLDGSDCLCPCSEDFDCGFSVLPNGEPIEMACSGFYCQCPCAKDDDDCIEEVCDACFEDPDDLEACGACYECEEGTECDFQQDCEELDVGCVLEGACSGGFCVTDPTPDENICKGLDPGFGEPRCFF